VTGKGIRFVKTTVQPIVSISLLVVTGVTVTLKALITEVTTLIRQM